MLKFDKKYLIRLYQEGFISEKLYKEIFQIYIKRSLPDNSFEFTKMLNKRNPYINSIRNIYNKYIAYPYLDKEFIEEISFILKKYNIKNIIDIFAGSGIFTYYLSQYNFDTKAYTLKADKYIESIQNSLKNFTLKNGYLNELKTHTEFYDLLQEKDYDLIIASWIPYQLEDSYKIIENLQENKFLLVITESEGGCIADDKFHKKLENLKLIYKFNNLKNFPGIHDQAFLYLKEN